MIVDLNVRSDDLLTTKSHVIVLIIVENTFHSLILCIFPTSNLIYSFITYYYSNILHLVPEQNVMPGFITTGSRGHNLADFAGLRFS